VLFELGQNLVVERHLIAADRTPIGRVEGKDYRLTREVAERQVSIRHDPEGEVGGGGSGGQDMRHFFRLTCVCEQARLLRCRRNLGRDPVPLP
jgi:hypothetical protein